MEQLKDKTKQDLRDFSDRALSFLVYNTEELWEQRDNESFLDLLHQRFIYTDRQLAAFLADREVEALEDVCEAGNRRFEGSESCEVEKCQSCCEHHEHDHYVCLDCDLEMEPSDFGNEDGDQER